MTHNDAMFNGLVRFDFHFQTSKMTFNMALPKDVHDFFKNLKYHFKDCMPDPDDELIVLYPTPQGRMAELKSNDDIEFLKKTKLCFDIATREIYCGIKLLIIVKKIKQLDDTNNQITVLRKKFDQLLCQAVKFESSTIKKLEESNTKILNDIRSLFLERHPFENSKNALNNGFSRKPNEPKIPELYFSSQKNITNEKSLSLKLPSVSVNQNSLKTEQTSRINNQPMESNKKTYSKENKDESLENLKKQGFENEFRNIIILIRFGYDYERALNYLKSNSS